jgi:hypothetical protein
MNPGLAGSPCSAISPGTSIRGYGPPHLLEEIRGSPGKYDVVDDAAATLAVHEGGELLPGKLPPRVCEPAVVGLTMGPERGDENGALGVLRYVHLDAQTPLLLEGVIRYVDPRENLESVMDFTR